MARGLTETWHQCDSDIALRRIIPSGYSCTQAARQATLSNSGSDSCVGGGVAIIHKNNLAMKKLKLDLKFSTFEFAAATATTTKAKLVFVVIYRPGSQALRESFFFELTSHHPVRSSCYLLG